MTIERCYGPPWLGDAGWGLPTEEEEPKGAAHPPSFPFLQKEPEGVFWEAGICHTSGGMTPHSLWSAPPAPSRLTGPKQEPRPGSRHLCLLLFAFLGPPSGPPSFLLSFMHRT